MSIIVFNQELAQQLLDSSEQFPVDFELAWQWLGYTRKERALNKLKKHFDHDMDFCTNYCKTPLGGRPSLSVFLSIDCFKSLGMMAGTEQGKEIRQYFLKCERIVKQVISTQAQPVLPQTYLEALKALVKSEEEKTLLAIQNEQLEKENEQLAEVIDELFNYSSIIRVAKFNNCSEKAFSWHKLKAASKVMNLEVKIVPCPRYGTKNLYSHDAWRFVYPEYKLPETTTLVIKS